MIIFVLDTLYRVYVAPTKNDLTEKKEYSREVVTSCGKNFHAVFAYTDTESRFQFSAAHMSSNIVIQPGTGHTPATTTKLNTAVGNDSVGCTVLRNASNKKWSSARVSAPCLTSGVHRWEVFVDRCVSKNVRL